MGRMLLKRGRVSTWTWRVSPPGERTSRAWGMEVGARGILIFIVVAR